MFCSLIAVALLMAFILLRYTPLSNYLPLQATRLQTQESIKMAKRIDLMSKRIDAQNLYIQELKRKSSGEYQTLDSIANIKTTASSAQPELISRSELDDTLRKKVLSSKSMALSVRTPQFINLRNSGQVQDEFFVPPLQGEISKPFDLSDNHHGIDIIAASNSPIKSIMDGHVITSDWTLESGNTIIIQHKYNLISVYKHNDALLKHEGQEVNAGEAIAIIGNTGMHSDGPHLHFEMWLEGKPLDPSEYLILPEE
jgi:murein DD-endopeptidase MepM/ murein hydrolase activator NlpD